MARLKSNQPWDFGVHILSSDKSHQSPEQLQNSLQLLQARGKKKTPKGSKRHLISLDASTSLAPAKELAASPLKFRGQETRPWGQYKTHIPYYSILFVFLPWCWAQAFVAKGAFVDLGAKSQLLFVKGSIWWLRVEFEGLPQGRAHYL